MHYIGVFYNFTYKSLVTMMSFLRIHVCKQKHCI